VQTAAFGNRVTKVLRIGRDSSGWCARFKHLRRHPLRKDKRGRPKVLRERELRIIRLAMDRALEII
jgi:hypothetical protein